MASLPSSVVYFVLPKIGADNTKALIQAKENRGKKIIYNTHPHLRSSLVHFCPQKYSPIKQVKQALLLVQTTPALSGRQIA